MIFIDSNVPMYLIGTEHSHKRDAQRVIERLIRDQEALVTDAEVLQEILHRYVAIRRPDAIQPAFDALLGIVDTVFPITAGDVATAKNILLGRTGRVSARDAIHVAVMQAHEIEQIVSFDRDYDSFEALERLC